MSEQQKKRSPHVRGALGGFSLKVPALRGAWTDCESKAFPLRESDQYRTLLSDSAERRRFFSLHGISIAPKLSQSGTHTPPIEYNEGIDIIKFEQIRRGMKRAHTLSGYRGPPNGTFTTKHDSWA